MKVGIVALSCTPETCKSKFDLTIDHMYKYSQDLYELYSICFIQGFSLTSTVSQNARYIRDDTCYQKGLSISEIRDYFTDRIIREYNFDYILFVDDDFKFRESSGEDLQYNIKFMEDHPEVGLINFKMTNKDCSDLSTYSKINPTFVYMRGGILVRTSAYHGWNLGNRNCTYYEECILATKIYEAGYDIYCSSTHNIHRTKWTGLGKTIERQYKDDFSQLKTGGRQILVSESLATPQYKDGRPNYRVPCKLSARVIKSHEDRQKYLKYKGLI